MTVEIVNCRECGVANTPRRQACRMCGEPLRPAEAQAKRRLRRRVLRRTDFLSAARANKRATNILVVVLLGIGGVLGYLIGWNVELFTTDVLARRHGDIWFVSPWGLQGAACLVGFGVLWSVITFLFGDRLVLGITGARVVSREQEPVLHNVVDEMAIAAGAMRPRVCVIETPALNAFATGMTPKHSVIGVTRGLLDTLDRNELQGVIAHEMGHVVNLDIRYATAVGVMVGLIALVSDMALRMLFYSGGGRRRGGKGGGAAVAVIILLLFAVLAPLFAKLVQMAVSRQREFLADATSVRLTRNPHGLISALEKLAASAEPFKGANRATQHLFIVNPFRNFSEKASRLLATHPPLELRIRRLTNLG